MKAECKAQAILEYLVVIIILVAVFMVISGYYKRSLQGRYRQAADVFGGGELYTPR